MAKAKSPLPQNVQLLQRRFDDAQQQFDAEFQARMSQYGVTLQEYEKKVADYSATAQDYLNRVDNYAKYMESFFLDPGGTNPEQFINYGGRYYWAEDVTPGLDLRGIEGFGGLTGGDYQFVKTGSRPHSFTYSQQVWVTSGRNELQTYTDYETRTTGSYQTVWVPNYSSPTGGTYQTQWVTKTETVPVQKSKTVWVDTSKFETQYFTSSSDLDVGYLRTRTSEGGFTTLRPEQFPERKMPEGEIGEAPEAPKAINVSDIRGEFEQEAQYYQKALGQVKSAAHRARRRTQVRPLLQGG